MNRNKVKILIILIATSEKLSSKQHAIKRMNVVFFFQVLIWVQQACGKQWGERDYLFFFSYGQNHDSLWLTVLRAVETTPAKKKKIIILDRDNFKELRKTEEQET